MKDGLTRKQKGSDMKAGIQEFVKNHRAKIVLISGAAAGQEFELDRDRLTLGRGPGVHLAFDDPAMSRQHAAIDFADGGFHLRDLGSTNGTSLNGHPVHEKEIEHGDRFEIGGQKFQLIIEEREVSTDAYELPTDL